MITTVPEINSTVCMTKSIVIVDEIIKNGDVVDVFPDTPPGNNIP